jgi:hypothetical protein
MEHISGRTLTVVFDHQSSNLPLQTLNFILTRTRHVLLSTLTKHISVDAESLHHVTSAQHHTFHCFRFNANGRGDSNRH